MGENVPENLAAGAHVAPLHRFNVVGTFIDVKQAREAVAAANTHGFDDRSTSFLAVEPDQTEPGDRVDTEGVTGDVGRRVTKGAIAGAAIGAVALAVPALGTVVGAGLLAAALGGGALGGATGAMVGAFSGLRDTDVWRDTYASLEAKMAVVGLHTDDPDAVRAAESLLRDHHAATVRSYGHGGESLTAP